jgi:hypothetical protein
MINSKNDSQPANARPEGCLPTTQAALSSADAAEWPAPERG